MAVTRNEEQACAQEKNRTCRVASQNAGFHLQCVKHRPEQIGSSAKERRSQQEKERRPRLMKCRWQPVARKNPGGNSSQKPHADQPATDSLNRNSYLVRTQIVRRLQHGLYEAKRQPRDEQQPGCDLNRQSSHGGLTGITQASDQNDRGCKRQMRNQCRCQ
jgi:hypothetical protein